ALRALGALGARARVPIVIALDQNDAVPGRTLASAVTRLHAVSGLVLVVTYLRTLWDQQRETLLEPERQRIEENRLVLEPPSLAGVPAFVEARLGVLHRDAATPRPSPLFPFLPDDFQRIATDRGRLLLRDWCRTLEALLGERLGLESSPAVVCRDTAAKSAL